MGIPIKVLCGDTLAKSSLEHLLEVQGISADGATGVILLVDKPLGWASLAHPDVVYDNCIILTDNFCPTYRLDLLERKPAAIISANSESEALIATIIAVKAGNTIYPKLSTPLTLVERRTLKMIALGYSNKGIAVARNVNENTIKNSVFEIYKKLNLKSRVQATHYYYGNWHLLLNWEPPRTIDQREHSTLEPYR